MQSVPSKKMAESQSFQPFKVKRRDAMNLESISRELSLLDEANSKVVELSHSNPVGKSYRKEIGCISSNLHDV